MPCRTLIVERESVIRRVLLKLVEMHGHEATAAATVGEALEEVERFQPECVLLDLAIDGGAGVEVLRVIRGRERPVKVALLSTYPADAPEVRQVTPLRPDAIFQKPLDISRVNDWLLAST
jgi:CheY-like chemotaxis protein